MNADVPPPAPGAPDPARVAILVPALNEERSIRAVVVGALAHCPNVIVVDDGSTDATVARLADLPVEVVRHPCRQGKGAALRSGFDAARARGFDGVLSMDGDGQHDPGDIPRLLSAARRHPDRIVIGARLRRRAEQPTYRRLANEFGDWGIAWAAGHRIADTQSGQRYYPKAVIALDPLTAEGFVFEADILIEAARRLGVGCVSVPIDSCYAADGEGKSLRRSHFRPLVDLYRITSHVVGRVVEFGHVGQRYRQARDSRPVIDDGDPDAMR